MGCNVFCAIDASAQKSTVHVELNESYLCRRNIIILLKHEDSHSSDSCHVYYS